MIRRLIGQLERIEAWKQQQIHPETAILARFILVAALAALVWLLVHNGPYTGEWPAV